MNDERRVLSRHQDDFEEPPDAIGSDDQNALLSLILLLAVADRMIDSVDHVGVVHSVLPGARRDPDAVSVTVAHAERQCFVDDAS
ncbi:hypothetical protein [Microbacterium sp. EST19A]|uniref:hypothetical protein n=1 Tax=Microbacterium sp. EST19A TaxID=2862681 RepID=UPI001CBF9ABB|nr:hypothetical protein [Microbacterium sp. EST19A]